MRRRIAVLLAAVLAASALAVLAPNTPALADTDVCAGTGTATLGAPGLYYPGFPNQAAGGLTTFSNSTTSGPPLTTTTTVNVHGPQNLVPVSFAGSGFVCVNKPGGLSASGLVSGWCGHSWGVGITNNGHRFAWVSAGGHLLVTGEIVGVVNAVPDALGGQSCLTGALAFIVNGAAALAHCLTIKNKLDILVSTTTQTLRTTDVPGVHTVNTHTTTNGSYHIWHKECVYGV